jgi:hypothetical protein
MKTFRPARAVLDAGEKILDRVVCVAGAVSFSQLPEFMQQYLQRLGGHLAEARLHLREFEQAASQSGRTLEQLAGASRASADAAVARLGGVMQATAERVADLAAAEQAIREATPWGRPWAFLHHLDFGIASDTWAVFKPAVPATCEGLIYAVAGMLAALVAYHGFVRGPILRVVTRPGRERASTLGPPHS